MQSHTSPKPANVEMAAVIHAWATALLVLVFVLIWAFTGATYFWPMWPALPLTLALALHCWVALLRTRPSLWQRPRVSFALAIQAGVSAALALFLIGIWGAAGGGDFWPEWPIMVLAVALTVHASVVFATGADERQLSERIDVLTSSRAGVVDAQEANLRRIERDLHDGAQARLVALGMSLGMAEQKLASEEPAQARELLAEARAGAEQALRELRDLARGIHPPVLADRGLEAAIRSLADLNPLRVEVSVKLPERPAPAVESAAYFVVAEGLANATKHARAQRVSIRVERHGDSLRLDVFDDGVGGADPGGGGLSGLRQRVEALDGSLRIASAPGGPTVLTAELPCAS